MLKRILVLFLFCAAIPAAVAAQNVEMVFTPGASDQALALKSALKVDQSHVTWFGALALAGASAERKKAYADKVKGMTAVVILGEDALKAVSEIEFSIPVIVVNAKGRTSAKNRIVRVFDAANAPSDAQAVSSPSAVAGMVGTSKEATLKGDVGPVVQALLTALR